MQLAWEEAEGVKLAAAGADMRAACLFVAGLRPEQDRADAFEVTLAVVGVKRQGTDQGVGGVADLTQSERRIFPPEAARSRGPRTDG